MADWRKVEDLVGLQTLKDEIDLVDDRRKTSVIHEKKDNKFKAMGDTLTT